MVEFNELDFGLNKVRIDSKLFNLLTKNAYRVYGLKNPNNPLIHVSYNYDTVDEAFDKHIENLAAFFEQNGMKFIAESGGGSEKVCIGFRRDLREHVILTSSILQTIVYCLEGRLDLGNNKKAKITGLPKFE
jgi:hypothetical protein